MYNNTSNTENLIENKLGFYTELKNKVLGLEKLRKCL